MMASDPQITFKPAVAADFDYYYAIRSAGMRPHVERLGRVWDEPRELRYHRERFRPESLRMIHADGKRVGFIGVRPETDNSTSIESFCLDPAVQKHGLGSRVLSMVLDEIDQAGGVAVLEVMPRSPAAHLFERFGFEKAGENSELIQYARPMKLAGSAKPQPD